MKNTSILLFLCFVLNACTVEPEPFEYGKDQCHYCKMNIVDKQHMAQYVTQKGKAFKFDAIECMVNQLNSSEKGEDNLAFVLVANYAHPGQLTNAHVANFLISTKIKSPMGANLTAFEKLEELEKALGNGPGEIYSWSELKNHMK